MRRDESKHTDINVESRINERQRKVFVLSLSFSLLLPPLSLLVTLLGRSRPPLFFLCGVNTTTTTNNNNKP